ncbi:MAG TPA: ABC transporter permease, partial [Chloroflexi bacterium]|nr:ABC transporter permease [Chloroflexota bacterium]
MLCALAVGTTLGLSAGYFGGLVDEVVMRILDAMMAFPAILLYLIILSAVGPS